MKVGLSQCVIISAIFAVIGFFTVQAIEVTNHTHIIVAVSLLMSGIITPIIASQFGNSSTKGSDNYSSGETATLYVGNLPYKANEEAVKAYFQTDLNVQSVRLMKDRKTGKRKGYGFVEVITSDVENAIQKFNDSVFQDRTLKVRPAKDKTVEQ